MYLGYAEKVSNDGFMDKLGGQPFWLDNQPPSLTLECKSCHLPLYLISQFDASLKQERYLYIFGCNKRACSFNGGWKVIRCCRPKQRCIKEEIKEEKPMKSIVPSFSFGATPAFGAKNATADDILSLLDKKPSYANAVGIPKEKTVELVKNTVKKIQLPAFPVFALEFESIDLDTHSDSDQEDIAQLEPDYSHEMDLLNKYLEETGGELTQNFGQLSIKETGEFDKEKYEIIEPEFMTDDFKKFQYHISMNPEQVMRYGGEVVWFSKAPASIPKCPHCQSERIFECQLMPNVLNMLPTEDNQTLEQSEDLSSFMAKHAKGMDFATLAIFTCLNDCIPSQDSICYVEEHIIAQIESFH